MPRFAESNYRLFFEECTGKCPFRYQIETAQTICEGRNCVLQIPTGCGKTWAVLAAFLYARDAGGPSRLIYALPLRTLAQGIYRVATDAAHKQGLPIEPVLTEKNLEIVSPFVTLQTGEQPDDPFFARGKIIVTTYDQVLSGLLGGPYGLSSRLRNINAAALAGAMVVFDEFHLMAPEKAFLTSVAGNRIFSGLTQAVYMTATATSPLIATLEEALQCTRITLSTEEAATIPSISDVSRNLVVENKPLSVEDVLNHCDGRSIVLLNTVGRAQAIYRDLNRVLKESGSDTFTVLLHSRFFQTHRREKEEALARFRESSEEKAILVATQVVEAGLDISCSNLHTELCPMNSLVQRAGRCARFRGETGVVHVYQLPEEERPWLPYGNANGEDVTLTRTRVLLDGVKAGAMGIDSIRDWVENVHADSDSHHLRETWRPRLRECLEKIEGNAIRNDSVRVADLIRREDTESLRVIVCREESLPFRPGQREGVTVSRWSLARLLSGAPSPGWFWDYSESTPCWRELRSRDDLEMAYVVALAPHVAAYDSCLGLRLGESGVEQSPPRTVIQRPGHRPLHAESWLEHATNVLQQCEQRFRTECPPGSSFDGGLETRYGLSHEQIGLLVRVIALLHDFGKLNQQWGEWAEAAQRFSDPERLRLLPLAHTDFDPDGPACAELDAVLRSKGIRRPPHAAQGAFLGGALYGKLLAGIPAEMRMVAASACAASIVAHHGGWIPDDISLTGLVPNYAAIVQKVLGVQPDGVDHARLLRISGKDKSRRLELLLSSIVASDKLERWWPLVAYLTRVLRLSDQRATAEGGSE